MNTKTQVNLKSLNQTLPKNQNGFSLIELLIVVSIVGILASIAVSKFWVYKHKARDAMAQSDLRNGITAQEATYAENNSFIACATPEDCQDLLPSLQLSKESDGSIACSIYNFTLTNPEYLEAEAKHQGSQTLFKYDAMQESRILAVP